jgi:hypothetical protein
MNHKDLVLNAVFLAILPHTIWHHVEKLLHELNKSGETEGFRIFILVAQQNRHIQNKIMCANINHMRFKVSK